MTQSTPPPGQQGGRKDLACAGGFTLIELITVIVILGILAAVVVSRGSVGNVSANARALEIRAQFRFIQLRAMKSSTAYGLSCDGTNYWGYNGTDPTALAQRIPLPGESSVLVDMSVLTGKGITMPAFTYSFDEYGIPYTGSPPIKLAAAASIPVTVEGVTKNLILTPETGYIPYW